MDEASEICSPILKTPLCKHKTEISLFISRTQMNPGKKFLCCPYWKVDNCGCWKWVKEGNNVFEGEKSIVIEIEELKRRMELVERRGIEAQQIKKTKKELMEEMVNIKSEIVDIRIEMQRMRLGMKELGGQAKANGKWKLLAIVVGFVLLGYMLPSYDRKGMLPLSF